MDVDVSGVYRSERGTVWRVNQSDDGHLSVQLLRDGDWIPGPIGMVGLRLSQGTTRLNDEAIRKLTE
ncbi:MAG: hypothetical protein HY658_13545 [Actinobacteria bacterium]|nr:hypothetical protein [Actinomycetota bacterium]